MYEELLPLWKARCRRIGRHDLADYSVTWVDHLYERKLSFEWIPVADTYDSCLVAGCMLFTWEQGISE